MSATYGNEPYSDTGESSQQQTGADSSSLLSASPGDSSLQSGHPTGGVVSSDSHGSILSSAVCTCDRKANFQTIVTHKPPVSVNSGIGCSSSGLFSIKPKPILIDKQSSEPNTPVARSIDRPIQRGNSDLSTRMVKKRVTLRHSLDSQTFNNVSGYSTLGPAVAAAAMAACGPASITARRFGGDGCVSGSSAATEIKTGSSLSIAPTIRIDSEHLYDKPSKIETGELACTCYCVEIADTQENVPLSLSANGSTKKATSTHIIEPITNIAVGSYVSGRLLNVGSIEEEEPDNVELLCSSADDHKLLPSTPETALTPATSLETTTLDANQQSPNLISTVKDNLHVESEEKASLLGNYSSLLGNGRSLTRRHAPLPHHPHYAHHQRLSTSSRHFTHRNAGNEGPDHL